MIVTEVDAAAVADNCPNTFCPERIIRIKKNDILIITTNVLKYQTDETALIFIEIGCPANRELKRVQRD
jgi:hypothetical protein